MRGPLVFMGVGPFAVPLLKELHARGEKLALVVTGPARPKGRGRAPAPTPVAEAAAALGLPVATPARVNDPEFMVFLSSLAPQFIALADYGQLLAPGLLAIPALGAVNLHPSLLPRWRGPAPVPFTIMAGDPLAGVSVMLMDAGMDTGPVLASVSWPLDPLTTGGELLERSALAGAPLLADTLEGLRAGEVKPVPQEESGATFSSLLGPELLTMDWNLSPLAASGRINALSPRPGVRSWLGGRMVKFLRAEPALGAGLPGVVVAAGGGGLIVGCGGGALKLVEVHPEGRKAMRAADFVNSGAAPAGSVFQTSNS